MDQIPFSTAQKPNSNKKWIIIGVIVFGVLFCIQYFASTFLNPAKMVEMAIEHETGADIGGDALNPFATRAFDPQGREIAISDTIDGRTVSLPAGWPNFLPVMKGGNIVMAGSLKESGQPVLVIYETSEEMLQIASFYKAQLTKDSFEVKEDTTPYSSILTFKKGAEDAGMIYIAKNNGMGTKGMTTVTMKLSYK